jgi:hypothetical protein
MSTHSLIAMKTEDGRFQAIYAHSDGYPTMNGLTLIQHYRTAEMVNALLDQGDMSILGEVIGERHSFDARYDTNQCTFYRRDRGDTNHKAEKVMTLQDLFAWADSVSVRFVYVFSDGNWCFTPITLDGKPTYPHLRALAVELAMEIS